MTLTTASDGGGSKYVWLGASDGITEGQWLGISTSFSYTNWGSGSLDQPDNFNNQDGLALGMENWPSGSTDGSGFGMLVFGMM